MATVNTDSRVARVSDIGASKYGELLDVAMCHRFKCKIRHDENWTGDRATLCPNPNWNDLKVVDAALVAPSCLYLMYTIRRIAGDKLFQGEVRP